MTIEELIEQYKLILSDLGDAVREKTGKTNKLGIDDIPKEILSIPANPVSSGLFKKLVERENPIIRSNELQGLEKLADYAFLNYKNLESLGLPASVETIGQQAFKGCENLSNLELPFVGDKKDGSGKSNFGSIFGAESLYKNSDYVPSSLKNVKITGENAIDNGAFYDCKDITAVDLKESLIKDIGILAFYGCNTLEKVELPDSIEHVGIGAFYGCDNLSYTLEGNIKYLGNSENPYLYCEGSLLDTSLTSITIHEGCKIIGAGAFLGCVFLSSVVFPETLEYIGDYAFRSCYTLSSDLQLPLSLKSIGKEAFRDCYAELLGYPVSGITRVIIPNRVQFIGRGAFRGCDKLTSITLPFAGRSKAENERHSHFGYIFGASGSSLNSKYIPRRLTSITLSSPSIIGDYAFEGCSNLTHISISDISLGYVGQHAFAGCDNLNYNEENGIKYLGNSTNPYLYCAGALDNTITSATIPDRCKFIGYRAFYNCSQLSSVVLPNSLYDIGDEAFYGCTSLSYNMVESKGFYIKYLGNSTNPYLYCAGADISSVDSEIGSFSIADRCEFIGSKAFENFKTKDTVCSVSKPSSVVISIASEAFKNSNLDYKSFYPRSRIGREAFRRSKISQGDIEVKHIEDYAFAECDNLGKYINLENSARISLVRVQSLGEYAFYNSRLTSVDFSLSNISHIRKYAFARALRYYYYNPVLNDGVEVIGEGAFSECRLDTLHLPKSIVSIEADAFYSCNPKRRVEYEGTLDDWVQISFGNFYSNPLRDGWDKTKFFAAESLIENDIALEKAYKVSDYAFCDYSSLHSISVPDTVTSIGESAFELCVNLKEITFGENSLYDFNSLLQDIVEDKLGNLADRIDLSGILKLDEDISKIKDYAFYETDLQEIDIPAGCRSIGKSAFRYSALTRVYIPKGVEEIKGAAFSVCYSLKNLDVDEDNLNYVMNDGILYTKDYSKLVQYLIAKNMSEVVIFDGVREIGESAFEGSTTLARVVIPASVAAVGKSAFYDCKKLQSSKTPVVVLAHLPLEQLKTVSLVGDGEVPDSIFKGSSAITTLDMSESSITSVGYQSFLNCSNLSSVTFAGTLKSIGQSAFEECSVSSISFPSGLESIGKWSFYNTYLSGQLTIPDSVTSIGHGAFKWCSRLTQVTIGNGIETLGEYAFYGCSSITKVRMTSSIPPQLEGYEVFPQGTIISVPVGSSAAYSEIWQNHLSTITIMEE